MMWKKLLSELMVSHLATATTVVSDALGFTGSYEIEESDFNTSSYTPAYDVEV